MTANDDTRSALLEAAGMVFAAKGYEATTVREICRHAGVANIAAVNYYFGDKETLYVEAVRTAFAGRHPRGVMPTLPPHTPPATRLREFVQHFTAELLGQEQEAWQLQLVGRELSQPTGACAAFVREFAKPHFVTLLDILNDIVAPQTSADDRHLIALSIIGQCVHHRCGRGIIALLVGEAETATFTAERVAAHVADFSLAALGLQRPAHAAAAETIRSPEASAKVFADASGSEGPQ